MDEYNNVMPESEDFCEGENSFVSDEGNQKLIEEISGFREDISYLRDLFVRRLNDDKQKNAVIQKLAEGATYAFIEPFLYDIILLLDRLEKSDDDFVASVHEELYGIINRRGVEKIKVTREFNPALYKAVKVSEESAADMLYVTGIIRNGYTFSGKVIRPAEVAVIKPVENRTESEVLG